MKFRADDGSEIDLSAKGDVLHIDVRFADGNAPPSLRLTGGPINPVLLRVRGTEALAIVQGIKRADAPATDGTWLHFEASDGKSVAINVENLAHNHNSGIIKDALLRWCEDRQKEAAQIRADNGQFGVGA